jgi:hypothetical protein
MLMQIEWGSPAVLRNATKKERMIYALALNKIPVSGGIYIFGRRFSKSFEALYVGQASNLRSRVKSQLNNLRLMQHLKHAKSGTRNLLVGQVKGQRGRNRGKALDLVERAFIRHFLSEGGDLVNMQGTRIRRHEIASNGKHPKRYFPGLIFLER